MSRVKSKLFIKSVYSKFIYIICPYTSSYISYHIEQATEEPYPVAVLLVACCFALMESLQIQICKQNTRTTRYQLRETKAERASCPSLLTGYPRSCFFACPLLALFLLVVFGAVYLPVPSTTVLCFAIFRWISAARLLPLWWLPSVWTTSSVDLELLSLSDSWSRMSTCLLL